MKLVFVRHLAVMIVLASSMEPAPAYTLTTKEFYSAFLDLLKTGNGAARERLVRTNRSTASDCFGILVHKVRDETDPKRLEAYRLLATELEELLSITSGKEDCEEAERIYQRGEKALASEERLEAFRRVLVLCPTRMDALLRHANLSKKLGQFDDAVAGYQKLLRLKECPPAAYLGVGEVLSSAGLFRRSVPYLEKAIHAEPDSKRGRLILELAVRQISSDREGFITSEELVDRLWNPLGGNLMCMCPFHAKLLGRVRLREVTFALDSVVLGSRAKAQLAELARALRTESLKYGHCLIEGHADATGTVDYNLALSLARAEAVKRYLVDALGTDPALLSVAGMGPARPWTTNRTSRGRRANRRIEIVSIDRRIGRAVRWESRSSCTSR